MAERCFSLSAFCRWWLGGGQGVMDDFFILPSLRRARGGAVVKFVEEFARDGGRVAKFLDVSVYGYFLSVWG